MKEIIAWSGSSGFCDNESVGKCEWMWCDVVRRSVPDLKLAICPFPFKGWKVRWSCQRVDDVGGWTGGRREDFGKGRPHAPSTSGANSDVGM